MAGGSTGTPWIPGSEKVTSEITMRYYNQTDKAEEWLKSVLTTFDSVKNIKFAESKDEETKGTTTKEINRTVTFSYSGEWRGLVDIEKATIKSGIPAALISHAYVAIGYQPTVGFDSKKLQASLNEVPGMKYVCCVKKTWADFYMDVTQLDPKKLIEAATGSRCAKARGLTHETVTLSLKEAGDVKGFVRGLLATMKVLLVVADDDTVTVTALRSISDVRYRRIAQKSGTKLGKIKRK